MELIFYLSRALRFDSSVTFPLKNLISIYPLSQFDLRDESIHLINSLSHSHKTFFLQAEITSLPAMPAIIVAVTSPYGPYLSYKEALTLNSLPTNDLRALIELGLQERSHDYNQLNRAIPFLLSIYRGKDRAYLSAKARLLLEGEKR